MSGALISLLFSFSSGFFFAQDPYFEMNSANLNTMNSYVNPIYGTVDPTSYPDHRYLLKYGSDGLVIDENSTDSSFKNYSWNLSDGIGLHIMSSYFGVILLIAMILWCGYVYRRYPNHPFSLFFGMIYELVFNFFEGILGEHQQMWIKNYVVTIFFIIVLSNILGLINDVLRFFFPWLLRNVTAPTGELEFNIGLAIVAVVITLIIQIRRLGFWKFLHEYVPITGKGLIEGNGFVARFFDILISLFIGLLDIVGTFAKVVSLSMRLFGNMSSGGILLNVIFVGIGGVTVWLWGFNFQILLPIIVYVQGLLVSVIQAFVFAMLVASFIKLADE